MLIRFFGFACLASVLFCSLVRAEEDAAARIIGGEDAVPGRYAYTVSLQYVFSLQHFCGGALIAPDVVLTAAHCLYESIPSDVAVRTRPHRLNDPLEQSEILPAAAIMLHPDFDYDLFSNDLALLKLNGTSLNQPLLTINSDPTLPFSDQTLTVMGWGVTNSSRSANTLQVLENATYIDLPTCRDLLLDFRVPPGFPSISEDFITDDMLCISKTLEEGRACYGDSGGPLVVPGTTAEEDIQVGIVSFSIFGCDTPVELPSVYSRTSANYEFIRTTLCRLSDFPPDYFDCASIPDTNAPSATPVAPTVSPAPSGIQTLITVTLFLGLEPTEVEWRVETLDADVIHQVEAGTYTEVFELVSTTISVPYGEILNLVVIDEFGVGLNPFAFFDGYDAANIFLGESTDLDQLLLRMNSAFFGGVVTTSFTSSEEGIIQTDFTSFPSVAPSFSMMPTQESEGNFVNVTLVINFDTYPTDTFWLIESTTTNETVAEGGSYSPFIGDSVTETLSLVANETYYFVVYDARANGMCCENGEGNIGLYLGNELLEDQLLMYENGEFTFISVHIFTVAANETFAYSAAPSMTPSVSLSPTVPRVPIGPPFPVTIRILLDFYPTETSWAIVDDTGYIFHEGLLSFDRDSDDFSFSDGPFNDGYVEETVMLELGGNYTFFIYDTWGDGLCCGAYGVLSAGTSFSEDQVLAYVPGNFSYVGQANFTASVDNVFNFTEPPVPQYTFSPTTSTYPTIAATETPSFAPSTSSVPTTTDQALVTIELDFQGFTYEKVGISIERVDTGRVVYRETGFSISAVFEGWNNTISLDLGREYLFTITDDEGLGFVEAFLYMGSEFDITKTIMAMEGFFGYVRKQFFVASEDGLLGYTNSPSLMPSTSPSSGPTLSSKPSFTPTVTALPTASPAPTGSETTVLVLIQFDFFPFETAWKIVDSDGVVVAEKPFFTYGLFSFVEFALEEVVLENGEEYVISFQDIGFDGMCCYAGEGQAFVFLGVEPDRNKALVYEDGQFLHESNHTFVVSSDSVLLNASVPEIPPLPTEAPTTSPSPTAQPSVSPGPTITAAPTGQETEVLLMIQLDGWPEETAWQLVHSDGTVIAEVPLFTYAGMWNEVITDIFTLVGGEEYTLYMEDLAGDGMCCFSGEGGAFVFLGIEPSYDTILAHEDGQFFRSSNQTFVVSEDSILSLSPLPSIPGLQPPNQNTTTNVTTAAPVTASPVTIDTTIAPVTSAPVTPAPVTSAPVTPAPVTSAPVIIQEEDDKKKKRKGKKKDKMKKKDEDKKKRKGRKKDQTNYSG